MRKITGYRFLRAFSAVFVTHFFVTLCYHGVFLNIFWTIYPFDEDYNKYDISNGIFHLFVLLISIPLALWILFFEPGKGQSGRIRKMTRYRLRQAVSTVIVVHFFAMTGYGMLLKFLSYPDSLSYIFTNIYFHIGMLTISIPLALWVLFVKIPHTLE
jgi:hypothetical protein